MKKSTYINPEVFSKIVEQPYLKRDWTGYKLGGGYGSVYGRRKIQNNVGRIMNKCPKMNTCRRLYSTLYQFRKGNWYNNGSFFAGLMAFCYEKIQHKLTFKPFEMKKTIVSTRKCCESLVFPDWAEQMLYDIWDSNPSFEDFLKVLDRNPILNFDLETSTNIYRLQGDDAIFGILCQIFTIHHQRAKINVKLIPDLPITNMPNISNFVSGVFFPVVVTKFSDRLVWEENEDGYFLIDEYGAAIDCARVGEYTCANDPLFNRLGFVYRSGRVNHTWRICWNWGEIVEAVKYYGGDVLVRGLSETFLRSDWRKFGPNGLLVVNNYNGQIGGIRNTHKTTNRFKPVRNMKMDVKKSGKYVINLKGEVVDVPPEGHVIYTNAELEDWFELGFLCSQD